MFLDVPLHPASNARSTYEHLGGIMERRDIGLALALVTLLCTTNVLAQTPWEMATAAANPLLAIDQHRATVVERIVVEWGDKLAGAQGGVTREQLREMLLAMRADQLLAASLAGSISGLRVVRASRPSHSFIVRSTSRNFAVAFVVLPQLRQVSASSLASFAIATSVVVRQCGQTIGNVGLLGFIR
jgi:hypothetical protein